MKELELLNLKLGLTELKNKLEKFAKGNWGHGGRPGSVGGSSGGGSGSGGGGGGDSGLKEYREGMSTIVDNFIKGKISANKAQKEVEKVADKFGFDYMDVREQFLDNLPKKLKKQFPDYDPDMDE